MLPALSISRAELASLSSAAVNAPAGAAALARARRPSLPPLPLLRQGAPVAGSPVNSSCNSVAFHEPLETTARRLSLPPAYYSAASRLRRNGCEAMDQS